MNCKTKIGTVPSYVNIHIHEKCLIINKSGVNQLFQFNEADKMILELSKYVDELYIDNIKEYITNNCSQVKFTNKKDPPKQLSLF